MIGTISLGKSFYHCISYCLEDKRQLLESDEKSQSEMEGLQHYNRAEVLEYNKCFGNKHELADQFNDVRKLSKRVEKPVLHMSLRLAPGEMLSRQQLTEMGRTLAKEFGVDDNQYLTILHKDTREQHIHLVANRVGYNGKSASTSNNFQKMDRLCRSLEKEYQLREVLSAKRFLSKEHRLIPRHDIRKEQLKTDIRQTLEKISNYPDFEKRIESLGYKVIKRRGISFVDDKKVKIKGSEIGYSLAKIERIIQLKQQLKMSRVESIKRNNISASFSNSQILSQLSHEKHENSNSASLLIEKELNNLLYQLLKNDQISESLNQEMTKELIRKKKPRHRHHH